MNPLNVRSTAPRGGPLALPVKIPAQLSVRQGQLQSASLVHPVPDSALPSVWNLAGARHGGAKSAGGATLPERTVPAIPTVSAIGWNPPYPNRILNQLPQGLRACRAPSANPPHYHRPTIRAAARRERRANRCRRPHSGPTMLSAIAEASLKTEDEPPK
jgi:hypothetical protein